MIGNDEPNYVFTNGCYRLRLKPDKEEFLPDLVAFLVTDGYATQMRALSRGSDGLAEVTINDVLSVVVPKIRDDRVRQQLMPFVNNLLTGKQSLSATVSSMIDSKLFQIPVPLQRPNHTVLV
jgi:type I restriction enzyme M protein